MYTLTVLLESSSGGGGGGRPCIGYAPSIFFLLCESHSLVKSDPELVRRRGVNVPCKVRAE